MAFRELSSVSLLSSLPSLPHLSVLYGFTDQLIPTILFFSPHSTPVQSNMSIPPTQTCNGTKKTKLTCTVSTIVRSSVIPASAPTPLHFTPLPPFLSLTQLLHLPPVDPSTTPVAESEAAAATCIAGCYVGAMTTVMNSTWRSRIQADVELCGCSAPNGAHVSREWNSQRGGGAGGVSAQCRCRGFFFLVIDTVCKRVCVSECTCGCVFAYSCIIWPSECHEFSCVTFPYREILLRNMRVWEMTISFP